MSPDSPSISVSVKPVSEISVEVTTDETGVSVASPILPIVAAANVGPQGPPGPEGPPGPGGGGNVGFYTTAVHEAGTTVVILQSEHGLAPNRGLNVMVLNEATGVYEIPGIVIAANGDVSIMFAAPVAANTKRINIVGNNA
jgi:hypothetical protein